MVVELRANLLEPVSCKCTVGNGHVVGGRLNKWQRQESWAKRRRPFKYDQPPDRSGINRGSGVTWENVGKRVSAPLRERSQV